MKLIRRRRLGLDPGIGGSAVGALTTNGLSTDPGAKPEDDGWKYQKGGF